MLNLVAASAYFLLIHFGVSGTKLRDTLVARLGECPFRCSCSPSVERPLSMPGDDVASGSNGCSLRQ